jgi:hypothetical protein
MLEIKPRQTTEEQKEICELCGIEFDPDCLAYSAKENGGLLGVSQFRIFGKYAVIYDLINVLNIDDLEALIIMGKATLNFINNCGIDDVIIKPQNNNLPQILGFKKDENGVYKLNLEGYFESPCEKQKNKRE